MVTFHRVGTAVLMLALVTVSTAAEVAAESAPASGAPLRDAFSNEALISPGSGMGAAGTASDFLIGRKSDEAKETVKVSPTISRGRRGMVLPEPRSLPALVRVQQNVPDRRRDSVWNGALIGAGIGAGGGYIWARNICGTTDDECFAIAGPAGILSGIGIGAAIGAVADALHK